MNPVFSIITVTLNCAEDARASAASVAAQRGVTLEHIVKDGCSKDGTPEAILDANPDAKVFVCADSGIFYAMNQALEHATGEYVLFLNAGDILASPDTLAEVARLIAERGLPDLAYADYRMRDSGIVIHSPCALGAFTLYRNTLCHQACYFRRDCYVRHGGFDTALRVQGDYDFLLRCVRDKRCTHAHMPIIVSVYKDGGFSVANGALALREAAQVRRRHYDAVRYNLYALLRALTLPGLRRYAARSRKAGKAYATLAGALNRLVR